MQLASCNVASGPHGLDCYRTWCEEEVRRILDDESRENKMKEAYLGRKTIEYYVAKQKPRISNVQSLCNRIVLSHQNIKLKSKSISPLFLLSFSADFVYSLSFFSSINALLKSVVQALL